MSAATVEEEKETVWDLMSLLFFSEVLVVKNEAVVGSYPASSQCYKAFTGLYLQVCKYRAILMPSVAISII